MLRISAVEVSALLALIPCRTDELHAEVFGNALNNDGLLALRDVNTRHARALVIEFSRSIPKVGERSDRSVALIVSDAILLGIGALEELRSQSAHKGIFQCLYVVFRHAIAEHGIEAIAEDFYLIA